jgi:dsRNA-specific ribonuclease
MTAKSSVTTSCSSSSSIAERAINIELSECKGILNPFNKNNKLIDKHKVQNILQRYGIYKTINNLALYQEALTHESYTTDYISAICYRDNVKIKENPDGCVLLQEKSYERLEFLGDAVLELIIAAYLHKRFPRENEGFMSALKVQLVNRNMLAHIAKLLGLNTYIILSKTLDDIQHARDDTKILCDVCEAFLAAIFIDFNTSVQRHGAATGGDFAPPTTAVITYNSSNGYHIAELFIITLLEDEHSKIDFTELILHDSNYKDQLLKYLKRTRKTTTHIEFKHDTTNIAIADGTSTKLVAILIISDGEILGRGSGITVKLAEHAASKDALQKFKVLEP